MYRPPVWSGFLTGIPLIVGQRIESQCFSQPFNATRRVPRERFAPGKMDQGTLRITGQKRIDEFDLMALH